jgi:hypothetical protein
VDFLERLQQRDFLRKFQFSVLQRLLMDVWIFVRLPKTPSAGQWRAVELDDGAPLLLRYKQR